MAQRNYIAASMARMPCGLALKEAGLAKNTGDASELIRAGRAYADGERIKPGQIIVPPVSLSLGLPDKPATFTRSVNLTAPA